MELINKQMAINTILGQPPEPHYPSWYAEQIKELPPAEPEKRTEECTETHGVCLDTISRQAALDIFDDYNVAVENGQIEAYSRDRKRLCDLPPAPLGTNLTEEYARAVRNWLVNYQVKCAELAGRYTPYEVLGWIVSDWRKENGIW